METSNRLRAYSESYPVGAAMGPSSSQELTTANLADRNAALPSTHAKGKRKVA